MPTISPARVIERDLAALQPARSQLDLGLEVLGPDGSVQYGAGGIWDTRKFRYTGPSPEPHRVKLVSSQVKAADQLARWFAAYDAQKDDRLALSICVDQRRGGKTWFCVSSIVTFTLRYPQSHIGTTVCAIVVPTFPQQREIHETIRAIIPAQWFRDKRVVYHKSENYYQFVTGAQIWIKSADRSDGLKLGRFSAVAINEAQQVDADALLNALGASVDEGGITWLAMNPPNSTKGLWAEDLHEAVNALDEHGKPLLDFAEEVRFPSSKNEAIDQKALSKYARLAAIIKPDQAKRDALGIWVKLRDVAYPKYSRSQHIKAEPIGWRDVTADVNGLTYMVPIGKARGFGAGMDYQRRPWCAFIEAKVLIAPPGVWVPPGTHVYVVRAEITNDVSSGDYWTEQLLCQKIDEHLEKSGRSADDYLLVGDATGKNQGASADQRGKHSDPATWSWAICEQYGWEPHGPIESYKWVSRGKGQGKEQKFSAVNPPVSVRLDVTNHILAENRLIITPDCPRTAESFRICDIRPTTRKPHGPGAHLTDAVSYLLYVWETALMEAGVIQRKEAA